MKRLIILVMFFIASLHATTLRNGAFAHQRRIMQIWKAVFEIKSYPALLMLAVACKNGEESENAAHWNHKPDIIEEWSTLGILRNGILDTETQDIIITTYFNDREPVWVGPEILKKQALATPQYYPVKTWVEKIPGYNLVQEIKWAKRIFSRVVPCEPANS